MKLKMIIVLALLITTGGAAQAQIDKDLNAFTQLDIEGYFKVKLVKGSNNHITIDGPSRLMEKVDIEEGGEELTLRLKPHPNNYEGEPLDVVLSYNGSIEEIEASLGAELNCKEVLKAQRMDIAAHTGGILELDVETEDLEVKASTGGIITLNGKVDYQEVKVNTGGIYNAYQLQSNQIEVKANTGGIAHLQVEQKMDAEANTGGMINYRGNPTVLITDTSLGGMIEGN